MLGLNYESSDEEEAVQPTTVQTNTASAEDIAHPSRLVNNTADVLKNHTEQSTRLEERTNESAGPPVEPSRAVDEPRSDDAIGPSQGPTMVPFATLPSAEAAPAEDDVGPLSPYTSTRARIRNLTLPTMPKFDIPPSPPGSPPPVSTKKFGDFLDLKRRGVHFNERVAKSSILRNPSHLQKLMDLTRMDETDQYASTLPKYVAVPTNFPKWAYVEQLTASQKATTKKREEERAKVQREAVEFVPASKSEASSRTTSPSRRGPKGSAAERVMAGVDRERSGSPAESGRTKRREYERRGGRDDDYSRRRHRSRSRSPKRRRP